MQQDNTGTDNEQCGRSAGPLLEYHRFCSYSSGEVRGVSVQQEHLYLVRQTKISVYEYHGSAGDQPQLCEELISNFEILDFCISEKYICTYSKNRVEVRDRRHWGNVVFSRAVEESEAVPNIILTEDWLYLSSFAEGVCLYERYSMREQDKRETIQLGKLVSQTGLEFYRENRPIFLAQLGAIKDFYIWPKSGEEVELGMLYVNSSMHRNFFQINNIRVEEVKIRKVYHHKITCVKYQHQSPEYVLLIVEDLKKGGQLHLYAYEILPKSHQNHQVRQGQQDSAPNFQVMMSQLKFLNTLDEKPASSSGQKFYNSLVNEIMEEAISENIEALPKNHYVDVKLQGLLGYESSFYEQGTLRVASRSCVCKLKLRSEQKIENILHKEGGSQRIVESVDYQRKNERWTVVGVYKQKLVLQENTISLQMAFSKQEEIQEQIEEIEINDEELEKNYQEINTPAQFQAICKDLLRITLEEKQREEAEERRKNKKRKQDKIEKLTLQAETQPYNTELLQSESVKSQKIFTHVGSGVENPREYSEFSCQTKEVEFASVQSQTESSEGEVHAKDFAQMQDLVLKYTTAVTRACNKAKEGLFQKQKFDKEIGGIVERVTLEVVKPLIEQNFLRTLNAKVEEVKEKLNGVFQHQLEMFNEHLREISLKDASLRGKKIFNLSAQIETVKETVSSTMESLKVREIHKLAFNQLVYEEAREIKGRVVGLQKSIVEHLGRCESVQGEIRGQIAEILGLIGQLQRKESQLSESGSSGESGEEQECKNSGQSEQQVEEGRPVLNITNPHNGMHPYFGLQYQKVGPTRQPHSNIERTGYQGFEPLQYPLPQYYPQMPPYLHPYPQTTFPFYYPQPPQNFRPNPSQYYPPPTPPHTHQYPLERTIAVNPPSKIKAARKAKDSKRSRKESD